MCARYKRLKHQSISPHIQDHHQHITSITNSKDLEELSTVVMKIVKEDQHCQNIKPPKCFIRLGLGFNS